MIKKISYQIVWILVFILNIHKRISLHKSLLIILISVSVGFTYVENSYAQQKTYSLNMTEIPMQEVLNEIEHNSGFKFFYNNNQVDVSRKVSINAKAKSLDYILNSILEGTGITYKILDNNIILSKQEAVDQSSENTKQNEKKITGKVVDDKGEPVIGALVAIGGTQNGTTSNIDGEFELTAPLNSELVVSFMGYVKVKVIIAKNKNYYPIVLKEDTKILDEVVVTALGIKREEKALGYAVQKVSGDVLTSVKGTNIATNLTGKVAGLNVFNSTEFNQAPSISLRGQNPLIVVDGVANEYISLSDIAADDIESIDILKGATASALYGERGGAGAVMITTKKAAIEGFHISVNSSTMFDAGYLRKPEVQSSYSTGQGGKYKPGSYVWGDKLDIGRTAQIYNPYTYELEERELVSKGKNNLKNFQELSFVTNNNVSISQKGKYGGVRASFSHLYNKGQFPNTKLNKFTYSISGEMSFDKFKFEGGLTYNKRSFPNDQGTGYGGGGLLYNLTVWTGTEYDIRDYKNYWVIPNEQQNWMDTNWYDNPYFIANEITRSNDYDIVNGYLNGEYKAADWLKFVARLGVDHYSSLDKWKNSKGAVGGWHKLGYYGVERDGAYSINGDVMAMFDKKVGDFNLEGFVGGSLFYKNNNSQISETQGGLSVPGFYSLNASISPIKSSSEFYRKQVNSLYSRFSASWKSTIFMDITGRNDWSSTMPKETQSYFYPSFSGSVVLSEFLPLPKFMEFWKIRGSWTQTKYDLGIYESNQLYSISSDIWKGLGTAYYPSTIRNVNIKPKATDTWELGTEFYLLNGAIKLDMTYYNALTYNQQEKAKVSKGSGFGETLINTKEDLRRKGFEITLNTKIINTSDWNWNMGVNWSKDIYTYDRIDPDYTADKPWVKDGATWNWFQIYDWERDPQGNIIHDGGLPQVSNYATLGGYRDPDFTWGINNSIRYKNVNLSFSFDGRVGGKLHSRTDQSMWNSGSHPDSDNQYRYDEVVNGLQNYVGAGVKVVSGSVDYDNYGNITRDDRVFAPNDEAVSYETYSITMAPYIGSVKPQFVYSQTFLKLRDLSLTYTVPKDICGKLKAKAASVAFIGQNLLMWTKDFRYSDPDKGGESLNSPSIRYIGVNIKLDF